MLTSLTALVLDINYLYKIMVVLRKLKEKFAFDETNEDKDAAEKHKKTMTSIVQNNA